MSVSQIPSQIKTLLWTKSGGRCEFDGCNKPLHYDLLTKRNCNSAYIAHIIADQATGPRGDKVLSHQYAKDAENLMLMCDTHHRMIDNNQNLEIYSVETLKEMKKKHEERIELLTSIQANKYSHVVLYSPSIGENSIRIDVNKVIQAMIPDYFPAEKNAIELSCNGSALKDNNKSYWEYERYQLKSMFESKIQQRIANGDIKHISIFALAPQPLLIELGKLISDIQATQVYQKHREPDSWKWLDSNENEKFIIKKPEKVSNIVALKLSLSGTISNERITNIFEDEVSIWELTMNNHNNDFLKAQSQVSEFRKIMRRLFDEIKSVHGQNSVLNVFPAVPSALAIEIGRVWMPKADMRLSLFDQNNVERKFVHAFDITN